MRFLFAALLTLIAAIAIALVTRDDPGYVMINFRGWTLEVSLALLVIAIVAGFVFFHTLLRLVSGVRRVPQRLRNWRRERRERRVRKALARGALALAAGQWDTAEKQLIKYSGGGEVQVLNYLYAARAAHQRRAFERRDQYLQLAYQEAPDAELAIAQTQAELLASEGRLEQALAIAARLHGLAPKNTSVLELMMRLYTLVCDWERLVELLPELRKRAVLDREEADRLETKAHIELLHRAAQSRERQVLGDAWQRVPAGVRREVEVVRAYVQHLLECGADAEAEAVLNQALGREWNDDLAYLYGVVKGAQPALQLEHAEHWLGKHSNDPRLLLTLGRLSRRAGLWGKARRYLEASSAVRAEAETYQELAAVLEQMGEAEAAADCYRKGLAVLGHTAPEPARPAGQAQLLPVP